VQASRGKNCLKMLNKLKAWRISSAAAAAVISPESWQQPAGTTSLLTANTFLFADNTGDDATVIIVINLPVC